jgi:hypothetical protein
MARPKLAQLLSLFALIFHGCSAKERLEVRPVVVSEAITLEGSGDTVDLSPISQASVSLGGFVVVSRVIAKTGLIAVYDSSGHLIRLVGRAGGGPGEVGSIGAVGFGPGDSVLAHDFQSNAVHVYAPPPELSYVRSFRVAAPLDHFNSTRV